MFKEHYESVTKHTHLRDLLQDTERNEKLIFKYKDDIILDFTHTKIDKEGLRWLGIVAEEMKVAQNIQKMISGEKINSTEKRQVWHVKLRT